MVVYGGEDGLLRLWNVREGKLLRIFEGHTRPISSVAWNADQRRVLSSSADRSVRMWDLITGECIRVLTGHDDEVVRVAWAPDSNHAFSGDRMGCIVVWDFSKLLTEKQLLEKQIAEATINQEAHIKEAEPYLLESRGLPEQAIYERQSAARWRLRRGQKRTF
jgi:WD40 repeat protein